MTRPSGQKWIFFNIESQQRTKVGMLTTFNHLFNITATHRFDSDIPVPYGPVCRSNRASIQRILTNAKQTENVMAVVKKKTSLVAWFVSHCQTPSGREDYVTELRRYVPVDIYGQCGDLKCNKTTQSSCQAMLNSKYKFYLSFENSLCRDYVTEKYFQTNALATVAIVLGGANYSRYSPPGTYIDVRDFRSVKHLAQYLKLLDSRPDLYAQFLLRKRAMTCDKPPAPFMCRVCKYIHEHAHVQQRVVLKEYWNVKTQCTQPKRNVSRKQPWLAGSSHYRWLCPNIEQWHFGGKVNIIQAAESTLDTILFAFKPMS